MAVKVRVSRPSIAGPHFSAVRFPSKAVRRLTAWTLFVACLAAAALVACASEETPPGEMPAPAKSEQATPAPTAEVETSARHMKSSRQGHSATTLSDGRLLVVGGSDEFGASPHGEIYDPAADTWAPIRAMRHARTLHTATLLDDGRVLVAGGEDSAGRMKRVEIFDPASGSWTDGPDLLSLRGGHTATPLGDGTRSAGGGHRCFGGQDG